MTSRRRFLGGTAWSLFLPFIRGGPAEAPPPVILAIPPPPGITVHATNTQMVRDRSGTIFAATRAATSIGGVVWRVDGYVSPDQPGQFGGYVINTPSNPQPERYFGNGELVIYPDGTLYYVTVSVDSLDPSRRNVIAVLAEPVPGWIV